MANFLAKMGQAAYKHGIEYKYYSAIKKEEMKDPPSFGKFLQN
jgi:hypothetical protein